MLGKLLRPQLIAALCRLSLNHLNPGMCHMRGYEVNLKGRRKGRELKDFRVVNVSEVYFIRLCVILSEGCHSYHLLNWPKTKGQLSLLNFPLN